MENPVSLKINKNTGCLRNIEQLQTKFPPGVSSRFHYLRKKEKKNSFPDVARSSPFVHRCSRVLGIIFFQQQEISVTDLRGRGHKDRGRGYYEGLVTTRKAWPFKWGVAMMVRAWL